MSGASPSAAYYTSYILTTSVSRPGDSKYDCSAGYGCPNPTLTLDAFNVFDNRYVDIDVGGPATFSFAVTSNTSWVKITPTQASLSPSNPEQRVFLSVDWSKVTGVQSAKLNFKATIQNDPLHKTQSVSVTLVANHTVVPNDFHGTFRAPSILTKSVLR